MLKKYEVSKAVASDEMVSIAVEYPDEATEGSLVITRHDGEIFEISNEGSVFIGSGADLAGGMNILTSIIFNLDPEQEWVRIDILLNGEPIVMHANPKSQDEHPTVKVWLESIA